MVFDLSLLLLPQLSRGHAGKISRGHGRVARAAELRRLPPQPRQKLLHPPVRLPAWPDAQRGTRLVLITLDMPEDYVRRLFSALTDRPAIDTPDRAALENNPLAIAGR